MANSWTFATPPGWMRVQDFGPEGAVYLNPNGLKVIVSDSDYPCAPGVEWRHVSFSRANRIPNYSDMQLVKKHFVGEKHKAVMVFPPRTEHVNLMQYCLHFWVPLGHDPLPDFTMGLGSI